VREAVVAREPVALSPEAALLRGVVPAGAAAFGWVDVRPDAVLSDRGCAGRFGDVDRGAEPVVGRAPSVVASVRAAGSLGASAGRVLSAGAVAAGAFGSLAGGFCELLSPRSEHAAVRARLNTATENSELFMLAPLAHRVQGLDQVARGE
jgi:hypothetical protein